MNSKAYEGTWKGTWNNKTIYINFKKVINVYNPNLKIYKDFLIGKFKVVNNANAVLFDNTAVIDNKAKINGGKFRKLDGKYSFSYSDPDLCFKNGYITIQFLDSSKTSLEWKFMEGSNLIEPDCFYHDLPAEQRPEPLPEEIVLIKQ